MTLTIAFRDTVIARAQRDGRFARSLLQDAVRECVEGDLNVGKSLLRDIVNATIGFEELGRRLSVPSKSLHRMLSDRGNPGSDSFLGILSALLEETGAQLQVVPRRVRRGRQRA